MSIWGMPRWVFMWVMATALFLVCKALALRRGPPGGGWRRAAFFLAWPGMDARVFLQGQATHPRPSEWIAALAKTALGAALYFAVARRFASPLVAGWVGMVGVIFLLHFGSFHLISAAWRSIGVDAQPIMRWPVAATSLGEFWGRRWNLAFNELAERFVFRPLVRKWGAARAGLAAFLVSGAIHELVISLPAGAGWGWPTLYFFLQGCGSVFERSRLGRKWGMRRGWRGWAFTLSVAAAPAFFLFHPPFVRQVILPMMQATGAL